MERKNGCARALAAVSAGAVSVLLAFAVNAAEVEPWFGAPIPASGEKPIPDIGMTAARIFDDPIPGLEKIGKLAIPASADIPESAPTSIGFECLDRGLFDPDRCYDVLAAAGVKWARCQTMWSRCEKQKGIYDFSVMDGVVENLTRRGIRPWFCVSFGNTLYMTNCFTGAAVGCVPTLYGDECRKAWCAYVRALARRYRGKVTHWEIWNEPNLRHFWQPSKPNAIDYLELVKLTGGIIREEIPDAKIGGTTSAPGLNAWEQTFFEAGGAAAIDFWCGHAYAYVPEIIKRVQKLPSGETTDYITALKYVRSFIDAHGGKHVDIWQGESGFPSWFPENHQAWVPGVCKEGWQSQANQAKWLLRRFVTDRRAGIVRTSFFQMADISRQYSMATLTKKHPAEHGIVNGWTYKPKMSYWAFENYNSLLATARHDDSVAVSLAPAADAGAPTVATTFRTPTGDPLFIYYTAFDFSGNYTGICYTARCDAKLTVPAALAPKDPVLVDMLRGDVYSVANRTKDGGSVTFPGLPLVDYPIVVADRSQVKMETTRDARPCRAEAPAYDVLVLGSPTALGQRYTKYFAEVADWLSLKCRVATEADFSDMWTIDDVCKEAELLVLPCNETIGRYPAELVRSFAERGGRLLVANCLPKGIEEALGVRRAGSVVQHDPLDPDLAGLVPVEGKLPPANAFAPLTRWAGEYTAPIAVPSGEGEVLAYWSGECGAKRDEPAVVSTPRGLFVSGLWFRGGNPMQMDFMEGLFRKALPGRRFVRKQAKKWTMRHSPPPNEHRGIWSHARGLAGSGKNWDQTCAFLKEKGFTDLYVLSAFAGGAFYASEVIPQAPHVAKYGDLLKQAIEGAHKHGLRCHSWKVNWRMDMYATSNQLAQARAAGKLQRTLNGQSCDWYCPTDPENQAREIAVMEELAKTGVDGVMFDFIRYASPFLCFCDGCRRRFAERMGDTPVDWPRDVLQGQRLHREWMDFRADALSTVVREGARRARLAKPGIKVSACGQMLSLFVDGGFATGVHYERCAQATPLWLKEGWVDYVCSMDYPKQTFDDLRETASRQDSVARGRVFPGIGMAAWTRPEGDTEKFNELLDAVRAAGCKGWCLYVLDDDRVEYHLPRIWE